MGNFLDLRIQYSAGFLQGPNGTAWNTALANTEESAVTRARDAIKASFPARNSSVAGAGVASALTQTGLDLQLPQGLAETSDQYRARLLTAFDLWSKAGTPAGVLAALAALGFTHARIYNNRQLAAAAGQVPDGNNALWSRAWIVVAPPPALTPLLWGTFNYAVTGVYSPPPPCWGGTINGDTASTVAALRQAVDLWRGAHAQYVGVFVLLAASDQMNIVGGHAAGWVESSATFYPTGTTGTPVGCVFWRLNGPMPPQPV